MLAQEQVVFPRMYSKLLFFGCVFVFVHSVSLKKRDPLTIPSVGSFINDRFRICQQHWSSRLFQKERKKGRNNETHKQNASLHACFFFFFLENCELQKYLSLWRMYMSLLCSGEVLCGFVHLPAPFLNVWSFDFGCCLNSCYSNSVYHPLFEHSEYSPSPPLLKLCFLF